MTWKEFKARAEELGVKDADEIGIGEIDDEGQALLLPLDIHVRVFPTKRDQS